VIVQRAIFRLRAVLSALTGLLIRKPWWRLQGMSIGSGTVLSSLRVNWPHKVSIGRGCIVEPDVFVKFDGPWSAGRAVEIGDRVFIGRGCEFNVVDRVAVGSGALISSGCKFIDHDHGIAPGLPIAPQRGVHGPIVVGAGAWLGANVIVLRGVSIGDGAVIGAGAVVGQSVPANEVWAGVPARFVRSRSARSAPDMAARA
jgi:acetyltransferase-like isoleucine patch superfamily enzyme